MKFHYSPEDDREVKKKYVTCRDCGAKVRANPRKNEKRKITFLGDIPMTLADNKDESYWYGSENIVKE